MNFKKNKLIIFTFQIIIINLLFYIIFEIQN